MNQEYNKIKEKEILERKPKQFKRKILSKVDKVFVNKYTKPAVKELNDIETLLDYNKVSILFNIEKFLKLTDEGIKEINEMKDISDEFKEFVIDIFSKNKQQVKDIYDFYKIKNFKTLDIDIYKEKETMRDFLDNLMKQHAKKQNTICYDVLKKDLQINFLVDSLLTNKTNLLVEFYSTLLDNNVKSQVYNYTEAELSFVDEIVTKKKTKLKDLKSNYYNMSFRNTPIVSLSKLYKCRKSIHSGIKVTNSNNSLQYIGGDLLDYYESEFEYDIKNFYKYIISDSHYAESVNIVLSETIQAEKLIENFI